MYLYRNAAQAFFKELRSINYHFSNLSCFYFFKASSGISLFKRFTLEWLIEKWHPGTFSATSQKISFKNLIHEVSLKIKV